MKFKLKSQFLALTSVALLSSCEWSGRQMNGMEDWANRNMPTFDGSRPGVQSQASQPILPNNYNGYPYTNADRTPMTAPGVSGHNVPVPPPLAYRENGMTGAQAASAAEGGNAHPMTPPPPQMNNYHAPMPPMAAPAMTPPPPPMSAAQPSSSGRRQPAGQLPPSAIQPAPYGAQQQPAKSDDFPSEYNKSGAPEPDFNSMIPPPPI